MLARVSRAMRADEPKPSARAGMMACAGVPQPATGSQRRPRAKTTISSGPSTISGTETPKTATDMPR